MRVIPSVEIEADAVLRLTIAIARLWFNVITSVGSPFSPTWSRREGEGREGRRVGGRDGGRKGGRGVLSQWKEGPLSVFQQFVFKLDIYSMNTCIIYIAP